MLGSALQRARGGGHKLINIGNLDVGNVGRIDFAVDGKIGEVNEGLCKNRRIL